MSPFSSSAAKAAPVSSCPRQRWAGQRIFCSGYLWAAQSSASRDRGIRRSTLHRRSVEASKGSIMFSAGGKDPWYRPSPFISRPLRECPVGEEGVDRQHVRQASATDRLQA